MGGAQSPGLGWWGRLFAGSATGDLESTWRRSANRYLAAIRLVTVPFVVALALTSDDVHHGWLAVVAVAAVAEMVPTGRWLARRAPPSHAPAVLTILMVDLALLTAAAAASGGGSSLALLIYPGLPLIAAIMLDPVALLILCSWAVGGRLLLGGDATAIATFAIELAWVALFAAALTARRSALVRSMSRVDATERALRARVPGSRSRLVADLRATVVAPVTAVRDGAHDAPDADRLRALAARLRTTILAVRGLLGELHVLAGRRDDLAAPLRLLVRRHAPAADLDLDLAPGADAHALSVATVVRDALPLLAGPATTEVRIAVEVEAEQVVVRLTTTPSAAGTSLSLLAVRPDVVRVRLQWPTATIVLRHLFAAPRPDRHAPAAIWATLTVALAGRLGLLVTIAAVALLSGPVDDWFWPLLAVEGLNLAALPLLAMLGRAIRAVYVAAAALDLLLLGAILVQAGDAGPALLAVAVVLPATVASILSSRWTAAATAAAAFGGPLLLAVPQPAFTIAVGWSGLVGISLALFTTAVANRLNGVRRNRNRLLTAMLASEERERQRLAQLVHDDALQLLLVAAQELDEAAAGDPVAGDAARSALDHAVADLERVATDLAIGEHVPALPGGLWPALRAIVEETGPALRLDVEPAAGGVHDGLLVATGRELYRNARRHGGAETVTITVARSDGQIVLEAWDDGRGFDPDQVDDAVARGQIGLAAVRERAGRAGGTVALLAADGGGARIRVALPADAGAG
ncbi:ATP-binding protein [Patulibacter defluvii]|uniref:ATP-binding protein n=1 Tax=Patulibacter defluvii TaxID=3095358 RepID=UPI002A74E831|nr:ATP-binding protein [Patulibacter sp. DM4]